VDLIQTQPLDLLTAGHIAERAGVSKALVFHYFPSHRELQASIARAAAEHMLEAFRLAGPFDGRASIEARIDAGIESFLTFVELQPVGYASLARAAASDEEMQQVFEDTRDAIADLVMEQAGLGEGTARVRAIVRGWISLAERMILDFVKEPVMPRDELVTYLREVAIDMFRRDLQAQVASIDLSAAPN
jgi:AcrR family transcriptional regulator